MGYAAVISGNNRADTRRELDYIAKGGAIWCLPILRGLALLELVTHFQHGAEAVARV